MLIIRVWKCFQNDSLSGQLRASNQKIEELQVQLQREETTRKEFENKCKILENVNKTEQIKVAKENFR